MNAYTAGAIAPPPTLSLTAVTDLIGGGGGALTPSPPPVAAAGGLNVPYAVLECLVAVGATVGNALVIVAFRRERRLRRRTNYYIVSLAVADLLVGLVGIPCAVLYSVGLPRHLHLCMLSVSLIVVLCTVSIFSLVAVSADRYWAILYPMAYSTNSNTTIAVSVIGVCWIMGLLIGFMPLLGWRAAKGPTLEACEFSSVMDYNYLVFLYFTTIILPALFMATSYAHIYTVVIKQIKQMALLNGGRRDGNSPTKMRVLGAARKSEVKATQNLSIIVAFFAVCWMPLYTINCVQAFCGECPVPAPLVDACIVLSHLNSAGNPLLYAYHLKDFRKAFRSLLLCKAPRPGHTASTAHVTTAAAAAVGNDSSVSSSSSTCSGGSDCWWRWPGGKNVAGTLSTAAAAVRGPQHASSRSAADDTTTTTTTTATATDRVHSSAPVLLSVRQLVQ